VLDYGSPSRRTRLLTARLTVTALLGFLAAPPAWAQPAALTARLDERLARVPQNTRIGLLVAEADSGAVWYAHDADALLKPASVQKLFVTAAALERFGPDFRFETRLYARGDEVWILGGGDPGFGDERIEQRQNCRLTRIFDEWAAALRAQGTTAIGKLVLDDSIFDALVRHPDWPDDQSDRWYQAPVGGLNINNNCLDVTVVVRGRDISLRLHPDVSTELIRNTLQRGKQQRPVLKRPPNSDVFQLSGTVTRGGPLDPVCVNQPTMFFAHAVRAALQQRGISIRGDVVRRQLTAPELAGAKLLATHATALPDVLWRCNTFSQNMFAESLLKSLAAYGPDGQRGNASGSWDAGRALARATLERLGINMTGATLRDGSGLSHDNRATATQFTRLLIRMRRHPHADVFLKSLAAAGEEGSMQRRYGDSALRGRLRGKTGTIAGVHTFAGYLTRPDGTVLAVAVLVNGPAANNLPPDVCKLLATVD